MTIDPTIFRAYDIRGTYPDKVNPELAYAIGQAYAKYFQPKNVVVGHDVRASGPELYQALTNGLIDAGLHVIGIGEISTEMLHFTVGQYGYDGGIAISASHNPVQYNGFKFIGKGATPISKATGIGQMELLIPDLLAHPVKFNPKGSYETKDFFEDYKQFVLKFIDTSKIKPMTVVANGNFGYQVRYVQKILENLPITLISLNGEPDGTFPKGPPDPMQSSNRIEFLEKVKQEKPDFGVAWDGDGDRAFFVTHDGVFVESYYLIAYLAKLLLKQSPNEAIIYDTRYTWAIIDAVTQAGGRPIVAPAGSPFIKQKMRETNALFCGEASGHYYFRDYFFADSGIVPFLYMLELLSTSEETLGELMRPYMEKYFISREINFVASNFEEIITKLKQKYSDAPIIDELDRLTLEYNRDWRFNIRTSNTEPLLRLNIEAKNQALVDEKKLELIDFIKMNGRLPEPDIAKLYEGSEAIFCSQAN